MKKRFAYHIVVMVVAMSCINRPDMSDHDRKIVFGAIIGNNATSHDKDVEAYPAEIPFKVCAFCDEGVVIDGGVFTYTDDLWSAQPAYLWPSSSVDFYAFSPFSAPAEILRDKGVIFNDFSIAEHRDFLYANPLKEYSKPEIDIPVNLVFETPLCEVEFYAYSSSEDRVTTWITGLELHDVAHMADFVQLPTASWTSYDDFKNVEIYHGRHDLLNISQKVGETVLIIPQHLKIIVRYSYTLSGGDAVIQRAEELDLTKIPSTSLGNKKIYTIKVTEDLVTVQIPNISK